MKKHAGFTLIELVIGIAIMLIIFGGIVYIFGASSKSAIAGMNHKQAYESARVTMDEIKTSLRYADKDTITATTDSITYSTTADHPIFKEHWINNIADGASYYYTYKISWKDSNKAQLKIERSFTQINSDGTSKTLSVTSPVYFPTDNYVDANGAFTSTQYKNLGLAFPIVAKELTSSNISVYNVAIPIQYKDGTGTNKVDILQTEVTPTDYSQYAGTGGDTPKHDTETATAANTLIAAATAMYKNDSKSIASGNSVFSNLISGSASSIKKLGDSRNNLEAFLMNNEINGYKGSLENLESHSWIMVPTKSGNSVVSWTLYVAKNVIDDTSGINQSYGDNYDGLTTALKALAENDSKYIIRGNTGFLCYRYFSDGMSGSIKKDADGLIIEELGYTSGYRPSPDKTVRAINPDKWLSFKDSDGNSNFKNVQNDNGKTKYIEDQIGSTTPGTYQRIDYSQYDGAEYTKETCADKGKIYKYPYGKVTGTADPTT